HTCLVSALVLAFFCARVEGADSAGVKHYNQDVLPVLTERCYDCHGDGASKGNVTLDQFKSDQELLANRELWLKVLKNVRANLMPPDKKPRLPEKEIHQLEDWIK